MTVLAFDNEQIRIRARLAELNRMVEQLEAMANASRAIALAHDRAHSLRFAPTDRGEK